MLTGSVVAFLIGALLSEALLALQIEFFAFAAALPALGIEISCHGVSP